MYMLGEIRYTAVLQRPPQKEAWVPMMCVMYTIQRPLKVIVVALAGSGHVVVIVSVGSLFVVELVVVLVADLIEEFL